jgi:pyridoxine 4-dehydrogenase
VRSVEPSGTFQLGDLRIRRLGYGAMHLSGAGIFGPPKDRDAALAVLREAIASGVNHIDTSDYYGPHITNQLIRDALQPYPDDLVIVTKIGARRGHDGAVLAASSPDELIRAVHDNLRNLDVDVLDVVNLRNMFDDAARAGESIDAGLTVLAELQRQGLVRHIGLSNVTPAQIAAGRRICDIVCVQNRYNLSDRTDDGLIDSLAEDRIAYVPFFPLGGFAPLQSSSPIRCRPAPQCHDGTSGARVAASPRAQHAADPRHVVAHTPPREHRGSGARPSRCSARGIGTWVSVRSSPLARFRHESPWKLRNNAFYAGVRIASHGQSGFRLASVLLPRTGCC